MPADYYGGSDEDSMDDKPEMGRDDDAGKVDEEEKDTTALIPKTLFAGKDFKPGDEIVLKIVHLYEDEAEVEYAHGDEKEEGKPEPSMMDQARGRMNAMAGGDE